MAKTPPTVADKPLTPKQERFVAEYLIDFNATQAAERAGYSPRTANEQGARLLANASVARAVEDRRQRQLVQLDIQASDVLREMARLAGSDIRQLFDVNGDLLPVKDWPDDIAACVAGIEVVMKNATAGDGKVDRVLKVKLWPKDKALEMLAKHKALFPREPAADLNVNVLVVNSTTDQLLDRARALLEKKGLRVLSGGKVA
jgi:phage terminase small subunit